LTRSDWLSGIHDTGFQNAATLGPTVVVDTATLVNGP
jgi:hypothetical protein